MIRRATNDFQSFSHTEIQTYLIDTRNRYKEYFDKIKFRKLFAHIDTMLNTVIFKIESILSSTENHGFDNMKDIGDILLLSFFIDCDLLFAIGACYLEDES
jgi:hypothetical protein